MAEITSVLHEKFLFSFIPADINDEIESRSYEGVEEDFQNLMKLHFSSAKLSQEGKLQALQKIKEESKGLLEDVNLSESSGFSSSYQIFPLILPSKQNNFEAVNCYLDEYGKFKNLPYNARASRICSNDIHGDCFMSKSYDDEDIFKRLDFDREDTLKMVTSPVKPMGKPASLLNSLNDILKTSDKSTDQAYIRKKIGDSGNEVKCCANCGKSTLEDTVKNESDKVHAGQNGKAGISRFLKQCSRCRSTWYCSVACQREDWKYHKRICSNLSIT